MSPRPKKHHKVHGLSMLLLAAVVLFLVVLLGMSSSNIRSQAEEPTSSASAVSSCGSDADRGKACVVYSWGEYMWPNIHNKKLGICEQNYRPSCETNNDPTTNNGFYLSTHCGNITSKEDCLDNQIGENNDLGCRWSNGQCLAHSCNEARYPKYAGKEEAACNRTFNGNKVCAFKKDFTSGTHCEASDSQPETCSAVNSALGTDGTAMSFCEGYVSPQGGACSVHYYGSECLSSSGEVVNCSQPNPNIHANYRIKWTCESVCVQGDNNEGTCKDLVSRGCVWKGGSVSGGTPSTAGKCVFVSGCDGFLEDICIKREQFGCYWDKGEHPVGGLPSPSCKKHTRSPLGASSFAAGLLADPTTSSMSAPPPPSE